MLNRLPGFSSISRRTTGASARRADAHVEAGLTALAYVALPLNLTAGTLNAVEGDYALAALFFLFALFDAIRAGRRHARSGNRQG